MNNAPKEDQMDPISPGLGDDELDQAIDDLRSAKASDADPLDMAPLDMPKGNVTDLADFGGDFQTDFASQPDFADAFATTDVSAGDASAFGDGLEEFATAPQAPPTSHMSGNLGLIMDIPVDVQIVLGSSRMPVSGLMNLSEGSTIPLDRRIGEAVEIVVNGRVIGRGEITVLEEDEARFGVKLIEINGTRKV